MSLRLLFASATARARLVQAAAMLPPQDAAEVEAERQRAAELQRMFAPPQQPSFAGLGFVAQRAPQAAPGAAKRCALPPGLREACLLCLSSGLVHASESADAIVRGNVHVHITALSTPVIQRCPVMSENTVPNAVKSDNYTQLRSLRMQAMRTRCSSCRRCSSRGAAPPPSPAQTMAKTRGSTCATCLLRSTASTKAARHSSQAVHHRGNVS